MDDGNLTRHRYIDHLNDCAGSTLAGEISIDLPDLYSTNNASLFAATKEPAHYLGTFDAAATVVPV